MSRKQVRSEAARQRRRLRVRKRIFGKAERPRLSVFRSDKHIYAQVIDDTSGSTLAAASTMSKDLQIEDGSDKKARARAVGMLLAAHCREKGIEAVVFDRNGYLYHSGRVRALAEGAREGGLKF